MPVFEVAKIAWGNQTNLLALNSVLNGKRMMKLWIKLERDWERKFVIIQKMGKTEVMLYREKHADAYSTVQQLYP